MTYNSQETQIRNDLLDIYKTAIARVSGIEAVTSYLERHPLHGQYHLVAIGKAASSMTRGALSAAGDRISKGLIITKHGHLDEILKSNDRLHCIESDHPVPGVASLHAGRTLLRFIEQTSIDDKFLFLISGGTSSLVEALPQGLDLNALRALNRTLLSSGLDIHQMNSVRRSVSLIKGGRLAFYLKGRASLVLLISDVRGDDPAVIGSGLLFPSTTEGALPELPPSVRDLLDRIKPPGTLNEDIFTSVTTHIVAKLEDAKRAAAKQAKALGYAAYIHHEFLTGDAVETASLIVDRLTEAAPGVHIWGGETTVILPPSPGRGGRNQQLALAAALSLRARSHIHILAAGTDGTDGPTDDAGGLVDSGTIERGEREGLDGESCLKNADAGRFLNASGDLIITGPTGTNVMDLVIGLKMPE